MTDISHWRKFEPESRTVHETAHWIVVVRGKQISLGSTVFLLKRPVESLSLLNSDELVELPSVAGWFESKTFDLWDAERFNYISAMMKDPFFHIHAIPRYSSERSFNGHAWIDADWPKVANFRDVDTSEQDLAAIVAAMKD